MIRTIEELSLNAWPALHTLFYSGWILRLADGYTRRANSIVPLYASTGDVVEKIQAGEKVYRAKGQPVIFKLTAASQPETLDALLAARGYQVEARTSVQLLDLRPWNLAARPEVDLSQLDTEEWQAAFCRMSGVAGQRQSTHRRLLELLVPARCFASLRGDNQVTACGLGVLQDGYLGLFDIVVEAACRRRGQGERLVQSLLTWGARNGAHTAYLQVMLNNPPALRLYEKLGFREEYAYWYRVKP